MSELPSWQNHMRDYINDKERREVELRTDILKKVLRVCGIQRDETLVIDDEFQIDDMYSCGVELRDDELLFAVYKSERKGALGSLVGSRLNLKRIIKLDAIRGLGNSRQYLVTIVDEDMLIREVAGIFDID